MVRYVHVHVHHGIEHGKQQIGHIQQVKGMHEILKQLLPIANSSY